MKSLFVSVLTAVLLVVILRSDLTQWRIVNKADLANQAASTQPASSTQRTEPRVVERRVYVPVQARADHSGSWMHDPSYRTALEKTSVAGHPENAKDRDPEKTTPTPYGR